MSLGGEYGRLSYLSRGGGDGRLCFGGGGERCLRSLYGDNSRLYGAGDLARPGDLEYLRDLGGGDLARSALRGE